jgi:hypothetical protein
MRTKLLGLERGLLIAISACILLSSGCLKKTNLEDPQVGPAEDPNAVTQKMMSDVGVFAIDEMKAGEYSSIVQTQIIEETEVKKYFQQDVYVDKIETVGDQQNFILSMNFLDLQNQANSAYNVPYVIKSSDDLRTKEAPLVLFYEYLQMAMFGCKQDNVTCHDLSISQETLLLKSELADPSICANPDRCEVRTKTISINMLKIISDGSRQKRNYTFVVAPQLPFLSRVLKYCVRRVEKASPRNILVEDCFSVTGFRAGTTVVPN